MTTLQYKPLVFILALASCMNRADEYTYEDTAIVCKGQTVDQQKMLARMAPQMVDALMAKGWSRKSVELVGFGKPDVIGYSKTDSHQPKVRLSYIDTAAPGGNGIGVVIDPCNEKILDMSYIYFP